MQRKFLILILMLISYSSFAAEDTNVSLSTTTLGNYHRFDPLRGDPFPSRRFCVIIENHHRCIPIIRSTADIQVLANIETKDYHCQVSILFPANDPNPNLASTSCGKTMPLVPLTRPLIDLQPAGSNTYNLKIS